MEDRSEDKLLQVIRHYQDSVNKYLKSGNDFKILHAINRLNELPITVAHLQETGVGRTINALRKYDGEVGHASRSIIAKWKNMVVEEDDGPEEDNCEKEPEVVQSHSERKSKSKYNHSESSDSETKNNKVKDKYKDENKYKENKYSDENRYKQEVKIKEESSNKKHKHHSDSSNKHKKETHHKEEKSSHRSSHNHSSDDKKHKKHEENHKHKEREKIDRKRKHSDEIPTSSKRHYYESEEELEQESDEDDRSSQQRFLESDNESDFQKENSPEPRKKHKSDKTHHKSDKYEKSEKHEKDRSKNKEHQNGHSSSKSSSKSSHRDLEEDSKHRKEKSEKSSRSEKSSKSEKSSTSEKSDKYKSESSKSETKTEKSSSKSDVKNTVKSDTKSEYKNDSQNDSKNSSKSDVKSDSKVQSPSKSKSKVKSSSSSSSNKSKKGILLDDGIDCESGASFAEALGMIEPLPMIRTSSKKKVNSGSPTPSTSKTTKPSKTADVIATLADSPDLLNSNIKLQPLDLNINSVLPEITTNYKPLPNIFPEFESPSNFSLKNMTEEEALEAVISSRTQRTKVYSGNKTWRFVPTLFNLCVKILQDHIDSLEYTGGVPYSILKPVLERATAEQLFNAEHHNPYLIDDTDELWELQCKKTFRGKLPYELESWRDMYLRCCDEREAKLKSLTQTIKQSQDKSLPVRQTKLAYVDSVVKPPRAIAKKQAKFGTAKALNTPTSKLNAVASAKTANAVSVPNPVHPRTASSSSGGIGKPKKAPLMQKALAAIKSRFRR